LLPFSGRPPLQRFAPRVYYGWILAVGASLNSFIVVGIGFYAMAVFLDALCTERGWPRTSVSFATTLYFVTTGLVGPFVGRGVDRYGPRLWIAIGALVMAGALLVIGRVEAPWQLWVVYPVLAVGFAMTGAVPASAIVTRWFTARRAVAMSIAQTGVSVGGVVLVPLVTRIILEEGLASATRLLAGLLVVIVLPVTAFVLRDDPRQLGLAPDGASDTVSVPPLDGPAWSQREAARTATFWRLVAAFSAILFCQVGAAMHQISVLRVHLEPELAALALSTTAAGSIVARLVVGSFADRVNQRRLGAALIGVQAAALVTFAFAESVTALFAASACFGFTIGNLFMLQSLLVADLFGARSFGSVFGLLQLLTQTASGLGPLALGALHALLGGYRPGLVVLVAIAIGAAFVLHGTRPPAFPTVQRAAS
jgi:MFS family permease